MHENDIQTNKHRPNILISEDKKAYNFALAELRDGNSDKARKMFEDFINDFPKSRLKSDAYFWYGESLYQLKEFELSAKAYLRCYKISPNSPKALEALVKSAYAFFYVDKKEKSCILINKVKSEINNNSQSNLRKKIANANIEFRCK